MVDSQAGHPGAVFSGCINGATKRCEQHLGHEPAKNSESVASPRGRGIGQTENTNYNANKESTLYGDYGCIAEELGEGPPELGDA
jgi:hypothetical protein